MNKRTVAPTLPGATQWDRFNALVRAVLPQQRTNPAPPKPAPKPKKAR